MSLLGGGSKSSIPSMSWDSITDKRSKSRRPSTRRDDRDDDTDEAESAVDAVDDRGEFAADDTGRGEGDRDASREPSASVPAPTSDAEVPPPPPPPPPAPPVTAAPETPKPFSFEPEPAMAFETRPLRLGALDPVDDAGTSMEAESLESATAVATASTEPTTVDPAVEPPSGEPTESSETPAGPVDEPVAAASPAEPIAPPSVPTTAAAVSAPSLPQTFAAPSAPATPSAVSTPHSALIAEAAASSQAKTRRRKQRSGRGLGMLLVLVLLAGVVAAGIIYGRPYLFPDEWDESARDYAHDIETIRGVEYTEPFLVIEEPTEDYRARVGNQLLGDWKDQEPMWRALGISSGGNDRETLDELIADRSQALYSVADGQVYHDASLPTVDRDPFVYRAMAEAAIDQQYRVTADADARSPLAEAMTAAHVLQQATAIQESSKAPTAIRPTDDAPLASLPSILDYQLVAPTVFAELLPPHSDVGANPLEGAAVDGAGPLFERQLELAPEPALAAGETVVGEPQPMSPSFWFLVFGSHLTPDLAWAMSNDIQQASLTEVTVGTESCFYSSFVPTPEGAGLMMMATSGWASAAAPELQATVQTTETEVIIRTCDPGNGFVSSARPAVARELIAHQATELAAVVGVAQAGGTQADLDEALDAVASSGAAEQVVAVASSASPTEMSTAAAAAVSPTVSPSGEQAPAEQAPVDG